MIIKDEDLEKEISKIDEELLGYNDIITKVKDLKMRKKGLKSRLDKIRMSKMSFFDAFNEWRKKPGGYHESWAIKEKDFPSLSRVTANANRYETIFIKEHHAWEYFKHLSELDPKTKICHLKS